MSIALHLIEIGLLIILIYRPLVVRVLETKLGVTDAPSTPAHMKPEHLLRLVGRDGSLHAEVTTYADMRPEEWTYKGRTYKPSAWRTKDGGVWLYKESK